MTTGTAAGDGLQQNAARRRIAVVGGGISGLGAAWALSSDHDVTLFEAAPRLGGHARTVMAGRNGDQPVDTGFIVFNHVNYPHFTALTRELDVATAPSAMSFGASFDGGRLEYALASMRSIFAQPGNAVRPAFLRMLRDIMRFNARAADHASDPDLTIGGLLERLGTGPWFRDYYLLPFSGAIWSTPTRSMLDFPAHALVRFFRNHALMDTKGQHQWYTIRDGSARYVERLAARLGERGATLRTGAPVRGVRRSGTGVEVRAEGDDWRAYDAVVMATHADDALALIADPTPTERARLGKVAFTTNRAVLHRDTGQMPRRRICWSAWNHTEPEGADPDRISLTYWMNALQPIPKDDPLFVTLNPDDRIPAETIYDEVTFAHPLYTKDTLDAQAEITAAQGEGGLWLCGAWMRNGFHEDGLATAYEAAESLKAALAAGRVAA